MRNSIDLVQETIGHFEEGARSVRAYTDDKTYIITKGAESAQFIITLEEPGFPKSSTDSLEGIFGEVFGIEAKY